MIGYSSINSTGLLIDTEIKESFNFVLPTKVTKLDPIFMLTFKAGNIDLTGSTLRVALNPKLAEKSGEDNLERLFQFNDDGCYQFNHEEFDNYFIDGDIQLLNSESEQSKKSCFVSITYGNRDEALHFIKGNFQLTQRDS